MGCVCRWSERLVVGVDLVINVGCSIRLVAAVGHHCSVRESFVDSWVFRAVAPCRQ